MDSLNRNLVLGLSGLAASVWLVAMIVALFFFPSAVNVVGEVVTFLAENSGLYLRLMFAAIFAVLLLASVLLMLVAYTPQQSTTRAVALPVVPGGVALITPEAIAHCIDLGLVDLPGVVRVGSEVKPHGRLVDVAVEVNTLLGMDLANKTAQVRDRVRRSISDLGLDLGRFRVFYHLDAMPPQRDEGP